jgi:hypothetical protein
MTFKSKQAFKIKITFFKNLKACPTCLFGMGFFNSHPAVDEFMEYHLYLKEPKNVPLSLET